MTREEVASVLVALKLHRSVLVNEGHIVNKAVGQIMKTPECRIIGQNFIARAFESNAWLDQLIFIVSDIEQELIVAQNKAEEKE